MSERVDYAIQALHRYKGAWASIAKHAGVSYAWVCTFGQGKIGNPTTRTLDRLVDTLRKADDGFITVKRANAKD